MHFLRHSVYKWPPRLNEETCRIQQSWDRCKVDVLSYWQPVEVSKHSHGLSCSSDQSAGGVVDWLYSLKLNVRQTVEHGVNCSSQAVTVQHYVDNTALSDDSKWIITWSSDCRMSVLLSLTDERYMENSGLYGVVQSVQHSGRTCQVRWMRPQPSARSAHHLFVFPCYYLYIMWWNITYLTLDLFWGKAAVFSVMQIFAMFFSLILHSPYII